MNKFILSFLVIVILGACNENKAIGKASEPFKTDKVLISKAIKNLPPFEEVKWRGRLTGKDSVGSIPGPSSYRFWGYAKYDKNLLLGQLSNYEWVTPEAGWKPKFQFKAGEDLSGWKTSENFTKKIVNPLMTGKIYVCVEQGLLYYDLEGE